MYVSVRDTFKRRAYVYDYEAPPLRKAAAAASKSVVRWSEHLVATANPEALIETIYTYSILRELS
jgi:hypothetical protein